jgi:hypothetical protein
MRNRTKSPIGTEIMNSFITRVSIFIFSGIREIKKKYSLIVEIEYRNLNKSPDAFTLKLAVETYSLCSNCCIPLWYICVPLLSLSFR